MDKKDKKNSSKSDESTKTTKTDLKRISKDDLKDLIYSCNGNVLDINKVLSGDKDNRKQIYSYIAKYDLVDDLRKAKGYEKRLPILIGDLAVELTLDHLLSIRAGNLQKQDVVLLIFLLKSCADFVETKIKDIDPNDKDNSINQLVDIFSQLRTKQENTDV